MFLFSRVKKWLIGKLEFIVSYAKHNIYVRMAVSEIIKVNQLTANNLREFFNGYLETVFYPKIEALEKRIKQLEDMILRLKTEGV